MFTYPNNTGKFSVSCALDVKVYTAGARVLMVNTDGPAWGGSMSDLDAVLVRVNSSHRR